MTLEHESALAATSAKSGDISCPTSSAIPSDVERSETPSDATLPLETQEPPTTHVPEEHVAIHDSTTFRRFAPFLTATAAYAYRSGNRFRADSFADYLELPRSASQDGLGSSEHASDATNTPGHSAEWSQAIRLAAPAVREYAARLRAGDQLLQEELDRAANIVLAETVRNVVVSHCRRLNMWPPSPPPVGVDDNDCSYEDMSASLDVIAQRAYNDEVRRLTDDGMDGVGGLHWRALKATYLVDFATEMGVNLPPISETFIQMLDDLGRRTAEWEGQDYGDHVPIESSSPFAMARWPFRSFSSFISALTPASTTCPYSLVIDSLVVSNLEVNDARDSSPVSVFVELELGYQCYSTTARVFTPENGRISFEGESCRFPFSGQAELTIRVRHQKQHKALLSRCPLCGEFRFPLGLELEDCETRKLELPLSKNSEHVGSVSLRLFLRAQAEVPVPLEPDLSRGSFRPSDPSSDDPASANMLTLAGGLASGALTSAFSNIMGVALTMEGIAREATLRTRSGYGTCTRQEASVIIVTEEGSGWCFYYPYRTREEANVYFSKRSWKITSRIMFSCRNGGILEELCCAGPSMPYATIRKVASTLVEDTTIVNNAKSG